MTEELILAVTGMSILAFSLVVASVTSGATDLRYPTPITVFLLAFLPNLLGSLYILFDVETLPEAVRIAQSEVLFAAFVFLLFGATIASGIANYRTGEVRRFVTGTDYGAGPVAKDVRVVLVFFAIAALVWLSYAATVEVVPIIAMVSHGASGLELRYIRAEGVHGLPLLINHSMNAFRLGFMPLLVIYTVLLSIQQGRIVFSRSRLFLFTLMVAVAFNSYSTALFPVTYLFVVLFVAFWVLGTLSLRLTLLLVALALVFPVFSDVFFDHPQGLSWAAVTDSVNRHVVRFFYDVPFSTAAYVEIFLDPRQRTDGAAHRPLALLLGLPHANVDTRVFLFLNPRGPQFGNASNPFYSYAYADFGIPGVALFAFVLGLILQWCHIWAVRSPRQPVYVARYIMVCVCGFATPATAVTIGVVSKGLLFAMLFPAIFLFVRGFVSGSGNQPVLGSVGKDQAQGEWKGCVPLEGKKEQNSR